ncbi:hypothetical protein K435DRAFT_800111 [Dendrothele bispora CBS 962.96]|uniref:Uncharacterized protein n=1 Tax=Dendrothele bispora (strain CBS 962.96) TaxID=1314807 RepID=A0A4S8LU95_DENBC|nr:hypothetical protein K435DRAFT_800111 [Dendrothele bispora CBS 962.96]
MAKYIFEQGCGAMLKQLNWVARVMASRIDSLLLLTTYLQAKTLREMLATSLVGLRGCWIAALRYLFPLPSPTTRLDEDDNEKDRRNNAFLNAYRLTSLPKNHHGSLFFIVLLVQGLFLHLPAVVALPDPDSSSFSNSCSSSPSPTPTPTPTPTIHTITFYMPSPFSETIFGMLYAKTSIGTVSPTATDRCAGADYTMYVKERVVNVPSATTLPPDFEGSPSVTINPCTSTVTAHIGTLISNGDSWHFETSDNSPIDFYEDCELADPNAVIRLSSSSSSSDKIGLSCDIRGLALFDIPFWICRQALIKINSTLEHLFGLARQRGASENDMSL